MDSKVDWRGVRQALARLYPDEQTARRVASDAGVPLERIVWSGSPLDRWHAVLNEASQHDLVEAVIAIATREYPRNRTLREASKPEVSPAWESLQPSSSQSVAFAKSKQSQYDARTTEGNRRLISALRRNLSIGDSYYLAKRISNVVKVITYLQGELIIVQGHLSSEVFFILEGKVNVICDRVVIRERAVFDHVGEMSAIDPGMPRTATVQAATDVVAASLTSEQLRAISDYRFWRNIAQTLNRRLREYCG